MADERPSLKDIAERVDSLEDQIQTLIEKQREVQTLLHKIDGGVLALKYTGAFVGFLLGLAECL